MEERTWLWVIDSISIHSNDSISCINICPLIIFKNQRPFKLIYTDKNGKLSSKPFPSQEEVLEIFKHNIKSIKGFNISGNFDYLTESEFISNLATSNYLAIQGYKEKNIYYHHTIEFNNNCYYSIPFIEKQGSFKDVNDLALEKNLLVYSINCIQLIEKNKEYNVNKIEILYMKDTIGKFWIEDITKAALIKFNFYRPSISRSKILISSSKTAQFIRKNHSEAKFSIKKNLLYQSFICQKLEGFSEKNLLKVFKPKVTISNTKISNFLPKIAENQSLVAKFICYGYYCERKIEIITISRLKRVSARIFYSLSHKIIKKTIDHIALPLSEKEFEEKFNNYYSKALQIFYGGSLNDHKSKVNHQGMDKKDTITLCPICFKILTLAAYIEMPLLEGLWNS